MKMSKEISILTDRYGEPDIYYKIDKLYRGQDVKKLKSYDYISDKYNIPKSETPIVIDNIVKSIGLSIEDKGGNISILGIFGISAKTIEDIKNVTSKENLRDLENVIKFNPNVLLESKNISLSILNKISSAIRKYNQYRKNNLV